MSDAESVASREDEMEEEYEEDPGGDEEADAISGDDAGDDVEVSDKEEEAKDEEKDPDALYTQHGAHREYRVPDNFILNRGTKTFKVKDGVQLGEILASRAVGKWSGLTHQHVTMLGGPNKMSGETEQAPYVIFELEGDVDTDDIRWLRPIPSAVMTHYQPKWIDNIKERCAGDSEKFKRQKKKYERVLKWTEEKLNGPRLNPERLGVGKGGFVLLNTKLKSAKISPEVQPRNAKGAKAEPKAKLTSAISKNSKARASTSDDLSETSEFTQCLDARTILLGNVDNVQCFTMNGKLYATIF